jgi:DNA-binding CsgD family transcriptional regulator
VTLALAGSHPRTEDLLVWLAIASGFSVLRVATIGRKVTTSTVVLDAIGTAVFMAGTGAPGSPFYLLALAGTWWAAHVPRTRGTMAYCVAFALAYLALVVPRTIGTPGSGHALEELASLVVVAILANRFIQVDRRAVALSDALYGAPFGAEQLAIREGLVRALRTMDIPVDVVLAAGQVGLTAVQAEILCYLMLGLTNVEISDAAGVSEATVRYRLTRLYRTLGVRGRKDAARRAHELGLSPPINPAARSLW